MTSYDIIGDVHGQFGKLASLLDRLGWQYIEGLYRHPHPDRRIVFTGDLIDRGDEQLEVLNLVRQMVESGVAQIVMGNHEFNAIGYATPVPGSTSEFLRPHSPKNSSQHAAFLEQVSEGAVRDHWIDWFRSLPLWLDLGGVRVVHACWDEASLEVLRGWLVDDRLPTEPTALAMGWNKHNEVGAAIEVVLKGPEVTCASIGVPTFMDGDHERKELRLRWWNRFGTKMHELLDPPRKATMKDGRPYPSLPDRPLPRRDYKYTGTVPIVFGHHWREWKSESGPHWQPEPGVDWSPNAACVDFSAGKDGPLVAYQWQGETEIDPTHYVAGSPA